MTKGNVDHWETDDVVYSGAEDTDTASFSVVSEITHPVFKDGGGGRPRMGVSICRTARKIDREFYLRLMCRDGNVEEVRALHMLLGEFLQREDEAKKKLARREEIWNERRVKEHERWEGEQKKKNGGSNKAGGGLGRFSKPGKTKRHRSNRRGHVDA